jgi:hypothetical protein
MKKNIGTADRIVRIIVGIAIAAAGVYYKSWWGLASLVPFITAATGTCWLWSVLGINTCKDGACEPKAPVQPAPAATANPSQPSEAAEPAPASPDQPMN